MRTLSIMQPWAWLLTNTNPATGKPYKTVENRSWKYKPKPAMQGPLLIHAGKKIDRDGYAWVRETFPDIPLPYVKELETGGIVGMAQFTGCVEEMDDPFFFGPLGLIMEGGKPLKLHPCNGQLGFFDVVYPDLDANAEKAAVVVSWTPEELKEFDRLSWQQGSRDQCERIAGRMEMAKFIALHGKEKCDAMFAEITKGDK